jgi:hypothetical protein
MRYGISCICFALALLLLGGPSASAGPLEDTASTVSSSLPDLPAAPIQAPSAEVPATPTVGVDLPAPAATDPPPAEISPVRSGGAAPSGSPASAGPQSGGAGPVRVATGPADSATGTAGEAAGTGAGHPTGDNGSPEGPTPTDARAGRHSVDPAHPAPLRRWLARVWPAIALGPFGGLFAAPGPSGGLRGLLSTPVAHRLQAILGPGGEWGVSGAHAGRSADSGSPFPGADVGQPGGLGASLLVLLLGSGTLVALLFLVLARGAGFPPRRLG